MRARIVYTIFIKEVLDTLRDRRTLFAMFVLPALLYPILFTLLGILGASGMAERRAFTPRVIVCGGAPGLLRDALAKEFGPSLSDGDPGDCGADADDRGKLERARRLIADGRCDLLLQVPPDASALLTSDGSLRVDLYFDEARARSDEGRERLERLVSETSARERESRLRRHSLPAGFDRPLAVDEHDLADKARRGAHAAGQMLPFILIFVMVLSGLLPAVDLTAGEKERGTLQTLLCAPVHSLEIVAGKYLTVLLLSLAGAAANLASMGYTLSRQLGALGQGEVEFHLGLGTAFAVFGALLPLSLLFSGLLLALATFARGFREANAYLSPVMLALSFPALVVLLPGIDLDAATAVLPVVNVALLIRELLGPGVSTALYLAVICANLGFAALAVMFAARVFETEQVLLGGESPWRDLLGNSTRETRTPSPRQTTFFAAALLFAIYHGALWMAARHLDGIEALAILQVALLLLPALAFLRLCRLDVRATLSLRLPSRKGWAGTLLFASGAWAVAGVVASAQRSLFPAAQEHQELFNQALGNLHASTPLLVLVIAVLPALVEEVCFRGVILSGFSNTGSRAFALTGSAVLFGIFHLDPHHAVATAVLGLCFAQAVISSGSILPAVLAHLVNNTLAVALLRHPGLAGSRAALPLLIVGCSLAALGLVLLRGGRSEAVPRAASGRASGTA